jgi:hypothetical protein
MKHRETGDFVKSWWLCWSGDDDDDDDATE